MATNKTDANDADALAQLAGRVLPRGSGQELRQHARAHAGRGARTAPRSGDAGGIGAVTASSFVAAVEDPENFKSSRSVGAWLGLTPRRYQSGEVDHSGSISRRGDPRLRGLLYEAAVVILTRHTGDSAIKTWGIGLRERLGFKRAAVAVARKLAVIMHRMLTTGEVVNSARLAAHQPDRRLSLDRPDHHNGPAPTAASGARSPTTPKCLAYICARSMYRPQHALRVQQKQKGGVIHCYLFDSVMEAQPDESLRELVEGEQHGRRGEPYRTWVMDVAERGDTGGSNDARGHEVRPGGKALGRDPSDSTPGHRRVEQAKRKKALQINSQAADEADVR